MTYVVTLNVTAPDDFTEEYVGELVSTLLDDGMEGAYRYGRRDGFAEDGEDDNIRDMTKLSIDVLSRGVTECRATKNR